MLTILESICFEIERKQQIKLKTKNLSKTNANHPKQLKTKYILRTVQSLLDYYSIH